MDRRWEKVVNSMRLRGWIGVLAVGILAAPAMAQDGGVEAGDTAWILASAAMVMLRMNRICVTG